AAADRGIGTGTGTGTGTRTGIVETGRHWPSAAAEYPQAAAVWSPGAGAIAGSCAAAAMLAGPAMATPGSWSPRPSSPPYLERTSHPTARARARATAAMCRFA
ncbi:hypothetical protein Vafri_6601, partial [Volvox africanus]